MIYNKSTNLTTELTRLNGRWAEVPFAHESERWDAEVDGTLVTAAVVSDQSRLVIVLEVIELFNDALHLHVDAVHVVLPQVQRHLVGGVLAEDAVEELVEGAQVEAGTL